MTEDISPDDWALLQYLRDHSIASGDRTSLDPKSIAKGLHISPGQLAANAAFTAAKGLVGVRRFRSEGPDVRSMPYSAIWLTSAGETFLKRQRSQKPK
jgi:hypothetical protein